MSNPALLQPSRAFSPLTFRSTRYTLPDGKVLQNDEENSNQFPLRIAEKFFFDPLKLDWVRARKGLASGLEAAWTECWAWQDDTSMEESVHKKLFDAVMGTLTPH